MYWGVPEAQNIVNWRRKWNPFTFVWDMSSSPQKPPMLNIFICLSRSLSTFLYPYCLTEDRYHSQMWSWDRHAQGKWHSRGTYLLYGCKHHYHFHSVLSVLVGNSSFMEWELYILFIHWPVNRHLQFCCLVGTHLRLLSFVGLTFFFFWNFF